MSWIGRGLSKQEKRGLVVSLQAWGASSVGVDGLHCYYLSLVCFLGFWFSFAGVGGFLGFGAFFCWSGWFIESLPCPVLTFIFRSVLLSWDVVYILLSTTICLVGSVELLLLLLCSVLLKAGGICSYISYVASTYVPASDNVVTTVVFGVRLRGIISELATVASIWYFLLLESNFAA